MSDSASTALRMLRQIAAKLMPKNAFAESRRITEVLRREAGGSFSVCYAALKAESEKVVPDGVLSEAAVVARVKAIRSGQGVGLPPTT